MNNLCRDIMTGFHRVNRLPLDDSVVVKYEDLEHYLTEGTAYAGQYILINFGTFIQPAVLMPLGEGVVVKLLLDWSNELQWELIDGSHYLMVYCYLKGKVDNNVTFLSVDSPFIFSMLPFANIFANSFGDIHWMLRRQHDNQIFFIQPNFVNTSIDIDNEARSFKIYSHSNSYGRYATSELRLSIMPYNEGSEQTRLFVKADDYYSILRGETNV